MSQEQKISNTNAIRFLKNASVKFEALSYTYVKSGTKAASSALSFPEHLIVKTLIFKDPLNNPFIVLMLGDLEVSTKKLSKELNFKNITLCTKQEAEKYSGYQTGGISPFGTKREMPVFIEKSVFENKEIYINGGKRGFLVKIEPSSLMSLNPQKILEMGY